MESFTDCIEAIKGQVKPRTKDIEFSRYVNYINAFLKHFGDERIYLVGSTGEGTKLTLPTDDGDADFLIVTGQINVSANSLKVRSDSPSYAWISVDSLPKYLHHHLIDDKYLNADILREVHPELFNIARGIYLHVSADIDGLEALNDDLTSLGVRSKVGLAHTTYRHIQIHGDLRQYREYFNQRHSTEVSHTRLELPPVRVEFHKEDSKILDRIFDLVKLAKRPGNPGRFSFFAILLEEALRSSHAKGNEWGRMDENEGNGENTVTEMLDDEQRHGRIEERKYMASLQKEETGVLPSNEEIDSEDLLNRRIKLTYTITSNKDFVPAIKVTGKLECMDRWKERVARLGWSQDVIDDLYTTDVFLISRESIICPNRSLDFCLAFGLHEQKLIKRFSENQKMVYLILKTFRRGHFDSKFRLKNISTKFRTYHIKTLAFWTFENQNILQNNALSAHEEILHWVIEVIRRLETAVDNKMLEHYFTGENLFANFNEQDLKIMKEILCCIQEAPIASLSESMKRNDVHEGEIFLSTDEIRSLLQLQEDGGKKDNIDRVRGALEDIARGLNMVKRDAKENSALKQAFVDVARLALQDEVQRISEVNALEGRGESVAETSATGHNNTKEKPVLQFGQVFKSVGKLLKTDQNKMQKNVDLFMNFTSLLCNVVPRAKSELDKIGGPDTIRTFLEGAGKIDSNTDSVNVEDIMQLADKYLTCTEAEKAALCTELKVKLACIFL